MGVKTKRSLALLVCLLSAASLSAIALSVAFADDGYVADADDSAGPFDIERFGFFQEETGGHLTLDLYEDIDPTLLDEELDWIGFILDDDIVNDGYVQAVFVTHTGNDLEAGLYDAGKGGPDEARFIKPVGVQLTDPNTLEVYVDDREYAWFHHWYAQTSFETIFADDRGFPECNWEAPPPRPTPAVGKCLDETESVYPTVPSPGPTVPDDTPQPCESQQSQCQENWVSIHYKDDAGVFRGRVHHRFRRCPSHRRVVLKKVGGGPGVVEFVGADETTAEGYWRIRFDPEPGKYRAVALRATKPAGEFTIVCKRDRSVTIRP